MRWLKGWLSVAGLAVAAGPSALAAVSAASPETLETLVSRARPGDTITLGAGEYHGIQIAKRSFDPALTLDATRATIVGVHVVGVDGLNIRGGDFRVPPPVPNPRTGAPAYTAALRIDRSARVTVTGGHFQGPGHTDAGDGLVYGEGYGVMINGGSDFVVENSSFFGLSASIVFSRVDNFRVSDITVKFMRSDGVDAAESHHGVIEGVHCMDTKIRDKEHPDCIQLWSSMTSSPTSDIVIRHNSVVGNTQGISLFNHANLGHDGGGFDRITIEDNDVEVSMPDGIFLVDSRDSIVRHNHVRTFGDGRYRANLFAPGAKMCGNVVGPGGGKAGYSDDKC